MAGFRPQRVGALIEKALAFMIMRELDFHGALVTITGVDMDKKLEHATVRFSVIPSEQFSAAKKILDVQAGYLQHLLLKKINIKPMPHIMFYEDHGFEKAANIEKKFLEFE